MNPYREEAEVEETPFRVCAECKHYRALPETRMHECRANPKYGTRDPITGETPIFYIMSTRYDKDWPNSDGSCAMWAALPKASLEDRGFSFSEEPKPEPEPSWKRSYLNAWKVDPDAAVFIHAMIALMLATVLIVIIY